MNHAFSIWNYVTAVEFQFDPVNICILYVLTVKFKKLTSSPQKTQYNL